MTNKRGRPKEFHAAITLRLEPKQLQALDCWAAKAGFVDRSAALRVAIDNLLKTKFEAW